MEKLRNLTIEDKKEAVATVAKEMKIQDASLVLITEEYYDAAMSLFTQFLRDEPLSASLEVGWNEEFDGMFRNALTHNLSIMIIDPKTKEPMALRFIKTTSGGQRADPKSLKIPKNATIVTFIDICDTKSGFYDKLGSDEAIHFFGLVVGDKFRNRGLGSKVFEAAIRMIQSLGLGQVCIKGEGTSNYSKKIYEKFGFQTLYEYRYDEYFVDGKQVFTNTGEHKSTKIYSKLL